MGPGSAARADARPGRFGRRCSRAGRRAPRHVRRLRQCRAVDGLWDGAVELRPVDHRPGTVVPGARCVVPDPCQRAHGRGSPFGGAPWSETDRILGRTGCAGSDDAAGAHHAGHTCRGSAPARHRHGRELQPGREPVEGQRGCTGTLVSRAGNPFRNRNGQHPQRRLPAARRRGGGAAVRVRRAARRLLDGRWPPMADRGHGRRTRPGSAATWASSSMAGRPTS